MADSTVTVAGRFRLHHRGPRGAMLWCAELGNGVTLQGADHLNAVTFRGATQSSAWSLGLISGSGYTGVSPLDSHASHAGWVEYALAARAAWASGTPAAGVLYSAASAAIAVPASGLVRGVFLANRYTAGSSDPAGVLYSTAVAAAGLAVVAGGTVYITYGLTAQGAP